MKLSLKLLPQNLVCISRDATEWFMTRGRKTTNFWGVTGDDYFWGLDTDGLLAVYSFSQRKLIHKISVENGIKQNLITNPDGTHGFEDEVSSQATLDVIACYDGRHVMVIQDFGRFKRRAVSIDIISGKIIAKNENLPGGGRQPAFQRPDGHVILNAYQTPNEEQLANINLRMGTGLMMLNTHCEIIEFDLFNADRGRDWGFAMPSPSGRYWLRTDRSVITIKNMKVATEKKGLFGTKTQTKTFYGQSIQIWEAFPLRFVRSVVVRWLTEDELPDEGFIDTGKNRKGLQPVRGKVYEKLSAELAAHYIDPLSALSSSEQLEASFDGFYRQFDWLDPTRKRNDHYSNYQKFNRPVTSWKDYILGWADEETFWVNNQYSFTRVDIDGTVWPKISRRSLTENTTGFKDLKKITFDVLSDKSLSITYRETEVIGKYSNAIYNHTYKRSHLTTAGLTLGNIEAVLTDAEIGWREIHVSEANIDDPTLAERALSYLKARMKYTIKLSSLSEPDCIQAIDDLVQQFNQELPQRGYESEIVLRFKGAGKVLDEKGFFTHVRENCPNAAPALRRLFLKYHACMSPFDHLYNDGTEGVEFLLTAATALGLLDVNSMDVMKLYAEQIDPSHQYYFCRETLPTLIKSHGMTDGVLSLAIYLMLFKSGNSDLPEVFWIEHGVKATLQALPIEHAKAIFANVLQQNSSESFEELRAHSFAGMIGDRIINTDDPWDRAFFGLS